MSNISYNQEAATPRPLRPLLWVRSSKTDIDLIRRRLRDAEADRRERFSKELAP